MQTEKKMSGLLFILIAAADMLTAGTELARGSVALICIRDNHSKISELFVIFYSILSIFSYNCSIFFNLVLTIVKKIHLSSRSCCCPSSSLHAGTSTTSSLLDYHALLTLPRGGTTVSGSSKYVPTPPPGIS